jgi:hypothetical protein
VNLTKRVTKGRWQTTYYENAAGEIVAKVCRKCNTLTGSEGFTSYKKGVGGLKSTCSKCEAQRKKDWRQENADKTVVYLSENKERIKDRRRDYRERNRESLAENEKRWKSNNKDRVVLAEQRRRARKKTLPNDLTYEQQNVVMAHFNNACALTGETTELHLDHVIPLATGHGGTTWGNTIPLRGDLNCSKNDSNLFEWFKSNRRRFELSQERFDALVQYLADVNEMTVEEYTKYYYGCFEGKAKEETA